MPSGDAPVTKQRLDSARDVRTNTVSSPRFGYGLAQQVSWSGLPVGGGGESSKRHTEAVSTTKSSKWKAATAALVAMNSRGTRPPPTESPAANLAMSRLGVAAKAWVDAWDQMIAPLHAAFDESTYAREGSSRSHDEAFHELETAFLSTDPARGIARSLVVKSTRAAARMRAAAERLELECERFRTKARAHMESSQGVLAVSDREWMACVDSLAAEVGRCERWYDGCIEEITLEHNRERAGHERMRSALESELAATIAQSKLDMEDLRQSHERDRERLQTDQSRRNERLESEMIELRQEMHDSKMRREAEFSERVAAMRQAHTAECEDLARQLRSTRMELREEEERNAQMRHDMTHLEAEHAQRHASQVMASTEMHAETQAKIESLELIRDDLEHELRSVVDTANRDNAELQGRVHHMRTVHSAALASKRLAGGKGRQMLFYESMKSASRLKSPGSTSSMTWRGPEATAGAGAEARRAAGEAADATANVAKVGRKHKTPMKVVMKTTVQQA